MNAETRRTNGLQVLDFSMRRVAKSKTSVTLAIDRVQAATVIATLEVVGVITEDEANEFTRKLAHKILEAEQSFDSIAIKS